MEYLGPLLILGGVLVIAMSLWDLLKVSSLPLSALGSLQEGLVMIKGRAIPLADLVDPIKNQACAWYRVWVMECGSGKYSMMRTVYQSESKEPFWVRDESGSVLVHPGGIFIDLPVEINELQRDLNYPIIENGFSPKVRAFLEAVKIHPGEGLRALFKLGSSNLKVSEAVIRPSQEVCLLGWARRQADEFHFYKEAGNPFFLTNSENSVTSYRRQQIFFILCGAAMTVIGILLAF